MNPVRATLEEYCRFISNPQKEGVWSIRVGLPEKQTAKILSFLNLPNYLSYHIRRKPYLSVARSLYYRYGSEERPPLLLPKIFAYVRVAIPKKERDMLPSLALQDGSLSAGRGISRRRFFTELLATPTTLGKNKLRILQKAVDIYRQNFQYCRVVIVPENVSKIDIVCPDPLTYLQVTEELPRGVGKSPPLQMAIRLSSPCEAILHEAKKILDLVAQAALDVELTKIFSPESTLMEMYLPMLQLVPINSVLKDKTAWGNVRQALYEAQEERFVHAIRATGIAAEELLVGIYETYLRDKAPEVPLGTLIKDLNNRLQEVVQGVKAAKENPLSVAHKFIGKAIEEEKKEAGNPGILVLAEQLQKNILPLLDNLRQCIEENPSLNLKAQKINLFPSQVQRCLSELVILRNRVSHRVERAVSVASVGYVDIAIALRDFIVAAKWWETERKQINYKATRKAIIQETVKRSKVQEQGPDETA